jgi:hypothetical protein
MKGDLPKEVRELEQKLSDMEAQRAGLEQAMKDAFKQRDNTDSDIIGLKQKLEKYKAQQYQVRTNKQYDALTREMDHATESVAKLEKEMEVLEGKALVAKADMETTQGKIEELKKLLEEKQVALSEVSKANEAEEQKYSHERQKILVRISKDDLATYERIRKAKKGSAIVPVKRGSCGGCYNRVPPQKLLELRQNNKVYTCESCGRILVPDEIVVKSSTVA